MRYSKKYKSRRKSSKRRITYRKKNMAEAGRTMSFTITKSVPISALYTRPIAFPLTIPSVVAVGTGQY